MLEKSSEFRLKLNNYIHFSTPHSKLTNEEMKNIIEENKEFIMNNDMQTISDDELKRIFEKFKKS